MSATSTGTISDSAMINVVGYDTPYEYGKVKDAVLNLGGAFYFKHDSENIVRVKDKSGKKKYFRKKSPLIYELSPGKFIHRAFLVKSEDGIYMDKTDPNTVFVNNKPTRKDFTVNIDGTYYLVTDPQLKRCHSSGEFCLQKDMILLNEKFYKNVWVSKNISNIVNLSDGPILQVDARTIMDKNGDIITTHRSELNSLFVNVFHKFRDSTNPQLDRIDLISLKQEHADETVIHPDLGIRIHKNHLSKFNKIYNDVILMREAAAADAIKNALKYSDAGPDENQAKTIKKIPQPWPGKYKIYTPPDMSNVISKTCRRTGGLKYTFGVEIETEQGLLPNSLAEHLKLRIVGDRSIGAAEYVSAVMHGDDGIDLLEKQCATIAKYCVVDDKCGIHWHVGGIKDVRGVAAADFDRHFCQYAISLACQIEKELFETLPPSRTPTLKHCHSIMRWKDISEENWREYLGAYVFGQEENWNNPFSFAGYKYGVDGRNRNYKLGDFCGGRYKWLNLVHILSRSSFKTCELRIFPGSTNFDKIYNYLLISMAFVWFVENKINRIIKGDVTLYEMLEAPFSKYPEIAQRLITFCEERKARFKRTNLYPSKIPKAIL